MPTLGVVPYLNALPLYRTLEEEGIPILRAVPAQLSSRLTEGACDAAIIPIVDYFRGVGEQVISDSCIGTDGAVRSVLLFHRAPITSLTRIAVDTSSHTSVALLRVLLADAFGVQPEFIPHAPQLEAMLESAEAALVIGDNALEAAASPQLRETQILDLGAAWKELTGLPFVFAAWVTRRGLSEVARDELAEVLNQARDAGTENLAAIVQHNPIRTSLSDQQIADYLRHAVDFHLTERHHAGMEEFRRRCEAHGLTRNWIHKASEGFPP